LNARSDALNQDDFPNESSIPNILVTAFEPYGRWQTNSSWLSLIELTRDLPAEASITTRRYPVDYKKVPQLLSRDLTDGYDFALHLGQSPGAASIQLEAFALNVRTSSSKESGSQFCALADSGPAAYRSELPVEYFASRLRGEGIPASVSHHAGTYLCNATLYWSQHLAREKSLSTRSMFVHLPLDVSQALEESPPTPSLATATIARGLRSLLTLLIERYRDNSAAV